MTVVRWGPTEPFSSSPSQLNAAGDRIRRTVEANEPLSDHDQQLLSDYRAWHYPALRQAHDRLKRLFHKRLQIDPTIIDVTARPLKTEAAIIAKLVREKTRLSRMQDIAGARVQVPTLELQEAVLKAVLKVFERCEPQVAKDTRAEPDRFGYRALHVVVMLGGRRVEIQIRTRSQDGWAQIVEKVDDTFSCDLKHGRGPAEWLQWLHELGDELRKGDLGQPFVVPKTPLDKESE